MKQSIKKDKSDSRDKSLKKWFSTFIGIPFIVELLIGVCLFLVFKSGIDEIMKSISSILFGKFESNTLSEVSLIVLVITIILGFVIPQKQPDWKFPNFRTSPKALMVWLAFSLIYLLAYRNSPNWTFYGWDYIKYADLILLFSTLDLFAWGFYLFKKPKPNESEGFIEDNPYKTNTPLEEFDDLFLYGNYAEKIADEIIKTYPKQSFTIGINGEWGSGKTTFMNMVATKASEKDPKITLVHFNAWESSSAKHIIPDFINELIIKVGIGNSYLAKKLGQYAEKLSPLDKSGWLKTIQSFVTKSNSISSIKDQVSEMLSKSGKRLLILIDDLDRLDKDELLEVYRLVRNSINFSNVIFMLAYDRGYVDDVIKKQSEHRAENFLEKIVNAEFSLPVMQISDLKERFKSDLIRFVNSFDKLSKEGKTQIQKEVENAIDSTQTYKLSELRKKEILEGIIGNVRDITRIVNSLKVNIPGIFGELLLRDFIFLEIIQVKFPEIGARLRLNPNEILVSSEIVKGTLSIVSEENIPEKVKGSKAIGLLKKIFPNDNYTHQDDPYKLGARHVSNYFLYFKNSFPSGLLSHVEYTNAKNSDISVFKEKINEYVEAGLEDDLCNRISSENIQLIQKTEQFKNIVEGLFYLASLNSRHESFYFVGFRSTDIQHWLLDTDKQISSKFFSSSSETMKQYVTGLLKVDSTDWNWGKSWLVDKMKHLSENEIFRDPYWLFSRSELLEFNIRYLDVALQKNERKRYNRILAYLLGRCTDKNSQNKVVDRAIEMIKVFCRQNNSLDSLYMSFIGRSKVVGAHYNTSTYSVLTDWNLFFTDENELITAAETLEFPYKDEYVSFLKYWFFEIRDHSKTVEYDFSDGFMEHLENFWTEFNEIPEMPID